MDRNDSPLTVALDVIAFTIVTVAVINGVYQIGRCGVGWAREGINYVKSKKTANV